MQVCRQCGVVMQPEQHACVQCGTLLVSQPVALEYPPTFASSPATPPAQHYLPAQPYVPPGQLFAAKYQHPYAHDQVAYGDAGAGDGAPSDEEPTAAVEEHPSASDPLLLAPTDLVQQAFLRYLPQYATNPIAGMLIGGGVAFLAVMVLTLLFLGVAGPLVGAVLFAPLGSLPITTPIPLHPIVTNGFFAVIGLEHHAAFTVTTTVGSYTLTYPLTTLLIIPALCLTVGGYVAAATDYTRRWRILLLRAATIGPSYALLLVLTSAIFGMTPLHDAIAGTRGNATFAIASASLLLNGMLWGIVFGGLGGAVRLFGWRWRAALVALLLGRPRSFLVAGMVSAFATIATGLMLTFVVGLFIVATDGTSSQLLAGLGHTNIWQNATPGFTLVLSAAMSVWLFIFGTGGTFTTTIGSPQTLPLTGTISVFDSRVSLPYLILLIIPALVYFGGGYLAARLTRSPNQKVHLRAGALVGVFGSVIMLLLATSCGYAFTLAAFATIGAQASTGPDAASTFLGSLIVGTICGVLGAFAFQPQHHPRQAPRPYPLEPIFACYDRWTLQPIGSLRPRARNLLYLAITVALTLAVIGIIVELLSGVLARIIGVIALQNDVTIYGGLMLAVPTLLLIAAWVIDLISLPQGTEIVLQTALPLAPDTAAPPSAPYEYPMYPLTLPAMPQIDRREPVPAVAPHSYAVTPGQEGMAS